MNVCVFCGSSIGDNPAYTESAETLGLKLAEQNFTLVYGGGKVGLMGVLADSVLKHNGKVIGVIPEFLLKKEVAHLNVTSLEVVQSMHERKKRMADLSDAFVALPGGWGTLDELAEILTWHQLNIIHKPIVILNVDGFFDYLIGQMRQMVLSGFLHQRNFEALQIVDSTPGLMKILISRLTSTFSV
jgi:uncharacterized protein (TIGR00730 family)